VFTLSLIKIEMIAYRRSRLCLRYPAKVILKRNAPDSRGLRGSDPAGVESQRENSMKTWNKPSRSILATLVAGAALLTTGTAFAQSERVIVSGGPAVVYEQPQMIPVGVNIVVGWHGDQYYDGHRYWAHDDWMRRHPHAHDPHRDDHH
jgi:hypothetical protein